MGKTRENLVKVPNPKDIPQYKIVQKLPDGAALVDPDDLPITCREIVNSGREDRIHTSGPEYGQKESLHERTPNGRFIMRGVRDGS